MNRKPDVLSDGGGVHCCIGAPVGSLWRYLRVTAKVTGSTREQRGIPICRYRLDHYLYAAPKLA